MSGKPTHPLKRIVHQKKVVPLEREPEPAREFDVTWKDLANPQRRWASLLAHIHETWVGDNLDRESSVRCGTVQVIDNREIRILLRAPLMDEE